MGNGRNVWEALATQAATYPERPFVECGGVQLSFADLANRAEAVAGGLASAGAEAGSRIAVIATNRIEYLELMFACARLGCVLVPINIYLKGEFLRHQLADSQPQFVVADDAGCSAVAQVLDDLPVAPRVIALDGASSSLPASLVTAYPELRRHAAPLPPAPVGPASLFSIMYTSGTTGWSKGCMLPHGYYVHVADVLREAWEIDSSDRLYTALPLFHLAAQAMVLMVALRQGAYLVLEPAFSASDLSRRWAETGATVFLGTGAMGIAALAAPGSDFDRAHRVRLAILIPFSPSDQGRFRERFGVSVYAELYGQTECVPISFSRVSGPRNPLSAGRPAPYLEVAVVDDDDRPVPAGEAGEIVVRPRSPHVMFQGYWRRAEETLHAWSNLWHHTGDYGRFDAEGYLYFVDRKKDAIRRRGENVSSLELEAAIVRHPKIREVAVHAVPSELTEDEIKACIVLVPGEEATPQELFQFFKQALPYYAIPRYVEIVPELPKNALGRVMKHLLRDRGVTAATWDFQAMGLVVEKGERR